MNISNPNFIGRMVIASAVFWILQIVAVSLLYSGMPYIGGASDVSSAMSVLVLIPLSLTFYRYYRASFRWPSQIAQFLGVAGMLAVGVTGFLVALRMGEFKQSLTPVMIGYGLIGVWLTVNNYFGLKDSDLPRKFTWLGLVVGIAMATTLLIGLFWIEDMFSMLTGFAGQSQGNGSNPLMMVVLFVGAPIHQLGYPIWAIWLGRMILAGKILLH